MILAIQIRVIDTDPYPGGQNDTDPTQLFFCQGLNPTESQQTDVSLDDEDIKHLQKITDFKSYAKVCVAPFLCLIACPLRQGYIFCKILCCCCLPMFH